MHLFIFKGVSHYNKKLNKCCWSKLLLIVVICTTKAWNCQTILSFSASCFSTEAGEKRRREDLASLFFVASAAVSWCRHISSSYPLPLFPSTSPHIHSVYDHTLVLPFFSAAQSVAFCPHVSSGFERRHPVISISKDLPALLPASLPISLLSAQPPRLSSCHSSANCHGWFMFYSSSIE